MHLCSYHMSWLCCCLHLLIVACRQDDSLYQHATSRYNVFLSPLFTFSLFFFPLSSLISS
eukprot:m.270318 g.270318  ORF g.270318 m.270318 type:complete len:60 (-) comp81346_c0_seq1:92-271(-)